MTQETDRDRTLAIQRRGVHERLRKAILRFKFQGFGPESGQYAQALEDLAALEVELKSHGQEP